MAEPVRIELQVTIEPGGVALTADGLAARLPGLALGVASALERVGPAFEGRIVASGELADVQDVVARHLGALRALSTELPPLVIWIRAAPDGDALRLCGGSFGEQEAEVAALLEPLVGAQHWRLYASFRLAEDGHAHLLRVVERALASLYTPIADSSPAALAIGFDIAGERDRVADVISLLRVAWRQEGSEVETLVEIEGSAPVIATLRTWAEWAALEDRIRASPREEPARRTLSVVRAVPELAELAGADELSWLDDDEQIYTIARGMLCTLSERRETEHGPREVRRRAGGALCVAAGDRIVDVPRAEPGVERRLHGPWQRGFLFSDTAGANERATTRLFMVGARVLEGPRLAQARGIDADTTEAFALADALDGALVGLGADWQRREGRPWSTADEPTDVAVVGPLRVAVTTSRGSRSTLYLVERENLAYARTLAVPCTAPQIVGAGRYLWLTGLAPGPGAPRCDLFRVDVDAGSVAMVTAELDAPTIDVVVVSGGAEAMLATPRGVYRVGRKALEEVVELAPGDAITGFAAGTTTAVFVRGARGARLVLGPRRVEVRLASAGYAPRFG